MTMRQFDTLPIASLVNEVPVDPVHVRELADSIKVSGPIAPVMVRQDTHELIDGFHRVAAMQELGFTHVECILTPCDDETFWDLRIMSASLHKSIAFARATDWVQECFAVSPWASRFKSAHVLFVAARQGILEPEAHAWVTEKSQKWGLAPTTIETWLFTKQSLAPDVLEGHSPGGEGIGYSQLREIAERLPNSPDLQRQVAAKVRAEGLSSKETAFVARAVKQAPNPELVSGILLQPVSRTADELTRSAIVERIPDLPKRESTPRERERGFQGVALDLAISLQQQVHNIGRLSDDAIAILSPDQRQRLIGLVRDLSEELEALRAKLEGSGGGQVVEGELVSGR